MDLLVKNAPAYFQVRRRLLCCALLCPAVPDLAKGWFDAPGLAFINLLPRGRRSASRRPAGSAPLLGQSGWLVQALRPPRLVLACAGC